MEGFRLFTVDTTGARLMLKALAKASQTDKLPDTEWRQALKSGGYELFFAHHNLTQNSARNSTCYSTRYSAAHATYSEKSVLTPEIFGAMIRSVIEKGASSTAYAAPHEKAARMCKAFENALQNLPQLQRDLEQLSKSDWSDNALWRAAEWLPEDARIEATVYIVLDGTSDIYLDHNRIALDLLQYNGEPTSLEKPIAHELHHIGYWSLCDPALLCGTNPESIAYRLAALFLAEGCATTFISGLPEPQDPQYVVWQDHIARLPEYFALTRDYLARIADGCITNDQFMDEIPHLYLQEDPNVACVMGVTMVQAIWKAFSKGGILHTLRNTALFFEIYRQAVDQLRAEGIGEGLYDL